MLKRYYYPVNPLCAMAAQGMKTVYQTHGIRLCDVRLLCLTGRTTMYESRAYLRPSTLPR